MIDTLWMIAGITGILALIALGLAVCAMLIFLCIWCVRMSVELWEDMKRG